MSASPPDVECALIASVVLKPAQLFVMLPYRKYPKWMF
ncbi:hypothetical protein IWQ48_005228 [Labrenzia sp. EL_13]|nr:hypothetical protein [Labrenzia sp. EL_13]